MRWEMKKIHLNPTEKKVLEMALNRDDRVQNHYSKEVFNCHYLADYISKLRKKLNHFFDADAFNILETEPHTVIKSDGSTSTIGIYRVNSNYRQSIKELLNKQVAKNEGEN